MHKLDMGSLKWTYEACYKEAKKYSKLKDFRKEAMSALNAAYENGWVKDYTWLKKRRCPWKFEEIEKLASQCDTLKEFKEKFPEAYCAVQKMHRSKDLPLKRKTQHTYEEVRKIALRYEYLKDFRRENDYLYTYALRRHWIETFDWLKIDTSPYSGDKDCCYMYINEEKKIVYVGRTIHPRERIYQHKYKKGGAGAKFKQYGVELPEPIYYMDAKFPVEYGLMIEDKLVKWFKDNGWTVLNQAKTGAKSGSIGQCKKKWTETAIKKAAANCETLKEFMEKYPSAYNVVKANHIELDLLRSKQPNGYWQNKERCREAALKCKGIREFSHRYGGAYTVAEANGWTEEFFGTAHKGVDMFSLEGKFLMHFRSQTEICKFLGIPRNSHISHCCNGKRETAYGYKWKFSTKK